MPDVPHYFNFGAIWHGPYESEEKAIQAARDAYRLPETFKVSTHAAGTITTNEARIDHIELDEIGSDTNGR